MLERIRQLLTQHHILLSAPIALSDCTVTRPYLLERAGIGTEGTAVIFAIPYHTAACEDKHRNLSRYAVGKDYHRFVAQLSEALLPSLSAEFPEARFALFADHSPIDERMAAVKAGIGIIGKNGLLITHPYSSYLFLGELITDRRLPTEPPHPILSCEDCGACRDACPMAQGAIGECLSALTQKKGELTEEEAEAIKRYGTVWGCDLCQEVCPHTKAALQRGTLDSPIPFFHEDPLPHLTYNGLASMTDTELSERAYAWRGRSVIMRNLAVTEGLHESEPEKTSP